MCSHLDARGCVVTLIFPCPNLPLGVPVALVEQLKPGGRMVIPVGRNHQELLLVWKDQNGKVSSNHLMDVRYVPLVKPHDLKV